MYKTRIKRFIGLVMLLAVAGVAFASSSTSLPGDNNRGLDLPSPVCDRIQVPAGNKLAFHVYAKGVQIYRWNGSAWVNSPQATLFADAGFHGQVGTHYAGPHWESNSGSKVKAVRSDGCSVDPTAIPWLLLRATETSGPGVFSSITFIQRVNTTGGLGPTAPGTSMNESVEVPYTAEYYFYRAED